MVLPYERRSYSQNNCTPFTFWIPIIKYVTDDFRVGRHTRSSPRCRYSQVKHSLAAQELPYARPQDFPTVGLSATRRHQQFSGCKGRRSCPLLGGGETKAKCRALSTVTQQSSDRSENGSRTFKLLLELNQTGHNTLATKTTCHRRK